MKDLTKLSKERQWELALRETLALLDELEATKIERYRAVKDMSVPQGKMDSFLRWVQNEYNPDKRNLKAKITSLKNKLGV